APSMKLRPTRPRTDRHPSTPRTGGTGSRPGLARSRLGPAQKDRRSRSTIYFRLSLGHDYSTRVPEIAPEGDPFYPESALALCRERTSGMRDRVMPFAG